MYSESVSYTHLKVIDWSKVDKEDYLLAMERSPIKDIEIKHLLNNALTDDVDSREVYMKGIDHSYYYEGYTCLLYPSFHFSFKSALFVFVLSALLIFKGFDEFFIFFCAGGG